MKRVAILGSTGSIGTQTLDVISKTESDFDVVGLTTNTNFELLIKQSNLYKPKHICITDTKTFEATRNFFKDIIVHNSISEFAESLECDLLVTAVVGSCGLKPTLIAINKDIDIALANKETMVMAGDIINKKLKSSSSKIFPIDSEHSAIWQSLRSGNNNEIDNIWITCSGGPFFGENSLYLENVSLEEALNHPTWKMGGKITIDSATLMNKGLEVIEAFYLFNIPIDKIKVVIHPQSIIHSIVQFVDGNYIAQLGAPDMRIPIQYALNHPNRLTNNFKKLNFYEIGKFEFFKPDTDTFSPLKLAYSSLKDGGIMPAALNTLNEIFVEAFLTKQIKFYDIIKYLEIEYQNLTNIKNCTIEDIINIDLELRNKIKSKYNLE